MHWRTMFDPGQYLGAWDLADPKNEGQYRDVTVTITGVRAGEMPIAGSSKTERRPIVSFAKTDKKMVLNKTNSKQIEELYGSETKAWVGKRVTLYKSTAKLKGKPVDCIRVRPVAPKASAPDYVPPEPVQIDSPSASDAAQEAVPA